MASEELDAPDGALGDVYALALSLQMAGQGEAALMLANAHGTILRWAIEREDQIASLSKQRDQMIEAAEKFIKEFEKTFYAKPGEGSGITASAGLHVAHGMARAALDAAKKEGK